MSAHDNRKKCICGNQASKKCSICEKIYCSRDCQVADWKDHKNECKRKETACELTNVLMVPTLFAACQAYEQNGSQQSDGQQRGSHRLVRAIKPISTGAIVILSLGLTDINSKIELKIAEDPEWANCLWPRDSDELTPERTRAKYKANHFQGKGSKTMMPCPLVTTINHSQMPNCVLDTLEAGYLVVVAVYALRDINVGEELTIYYGPSYKGPGSAAADGAAAGSAAGSAATAAIVKSFLDTSYIELNIPKIISMLKENKETVELALIHQASWISMTGAEPFRKDGGLVTIQLKSDPDAMEALAYSMCSNLDKVLSGELCLTSVNMSKIAEHARCKAAAP